MPLKSERLTMAFAYSSHASAKYSINDHFSSSLVAAVALSCAKNSDFLAELRFCNDLQTKYFTEMHVVVEFSSTARVAGDGFSHGWTS
jgi:hypothetical protein